jgi:hypothetical protein
VRYLLIAAVAICFLLFFPLGVVSVIAAQLYFSAHQQSKWVAIAWIAATCTLIVLLLLGQELGVLVNYPEAYSSSSS